MIALKKSEDKLAETPPKKDFWDKIGTFSTLISTLIIGGAGLIATTLYNNHELEIKHLDAIAQETRLSNQAKQDALIAKAKTLEALLKYISSEKPAERTFGYAMFAALDQGDLAETIIGTTRDQAGAPVAKALATNSDPHVADKATSALLTLDQQSRLVAAVAIIERGGEKTGYAYVSPAYDNSYLVYGINFWSFPEVTGQSLEDLLDRYVKEPGALYAADFRAFNKAIASSDKTLVNNSDFKNLLRKAGSDPAMVKTQDRLLTSAELEPKLQQIRQMGAKTALGAAMIFYVMFNEVRRDLEEIISSTDKLSNGSLNSVVDEKIWIKNLVMTICNKAPSETDNFHVYYTGKCRILRILLKSNDWNLDNIAETAKQF